MKEQSSFKKYIVVGGNPFTMYTGTTTFTALKKLGIFNTKKEASICIDLYYDECAGLIEMFEVQNEDMC